VIDSVYFKQAELLLRIIPLIDREAVFALKGGTAINFFVRDLPRISVDIDRLFPIPVYTPKPGGKTEIRMLGQFNQKLQSMITSANLTALGSFGIAFLLAGIFIDKIRKGLRTLWQKVYKLKPVPAETASDP
jgi:hypothetical protein